MFKTTARWQRQKGPDQTYVYIEFGPRGHIPDPGLLTREPAHGCVGEMATNGSAHDIETLNMLYDFWECRKEQRNIRQSPGCNDPSSSFGLREERVSHR